MKFLDVLKVAESTPVTRDRSNASLSTDDLQRMADDLHRAHTLIQAAAEESRKAAREACADIFLLQRQLDEENAYQSSVVKTMTSIVGVELMQGIKEQLDLAEKEGCLNFETVQDVAQTERKRRKGRTRAPYHTLTVGPPGSGTSGSPTFDYLRSASPYSSSSKRRSKRNRDEKYIAQEVDSSHPHKRPRLDGLSSINNTDPTINDTIVPQTILNYSTYDQGTDDTYSDSNGTERDFIDDPYPYYDSRGRPPRAELQLPTSRDPSSEEESDTDISSSQTGIRVPWSSIPDLDSADSSDSDYRPPDWHLEDIWEIENEWNRRKGEMHPLFWFNFTDELRKCGGVMSDGDLSTDDPDEGYLDLGTIQRPWRRPYPINENFPASLGPLLIRPRHDMRDNYPVGIDDEMFAQLRETAILRLNLSKWYMVKTSLLEDRFPPMDLGQRLADVLEPDHSHFYFDDQEWKYFVDPSATVFTRNLAEMTTLDEV